MIEDWHKSALRLNIGAARGLIPREHSAFKGLPVEISAGQATNYILEDEASSLWYLKRFLSGRRPADAYVQELAGLIPHGDQFVGGWRRNVLDGLSGRVEGLDVGWMNGCVLTPAVPGDLWRQWLTDLSEGNGASDRLETRVVAATELARAVSLMEATSISHRDLSGGNVLIHNGHIGLIDWDTMFHPRLGFQENTSAGSHGYMAPWIAGQARVSWRVRADRFALAVLIAEALTVTQGTKLRGDGNLFEQSEIDSSPPPADCLDRLGSIQPELPGLFQRAWTAGDFDSCPAPSEWLHAFGETSAIAAHAEMQEVVDGIEAGALTRVLTLMASNPHAATLLSFELSDRLARLKTSADALRDAIANGNVLVIAELVRERLVDRSQLRASLDYEVEQAAAQSDVIANLFAEVQRGGLPDRRAAFELGAGIPRELETQLRSLAAPPIPAPTKLPGRAVISVSPRPEVFEVDSIEEVRPVPLDAATLRTSMVGHIDNQSWKDASLSWFQLRALFPNEVTAADRDIGDAARAEWGRSLLGGG